MPGDGLTFTVEVGRQEDRVGRASGTGDVRDMAPTRLGDLVLGGEVVVHVHAELALAGILGQIADMTVAGQDPVVLAEIPLDRARLGR